MKIQESGEMYLETILVLSKQRQWVRSIDIAEHLGYSKPSVSRAMSLLRDGGLIKFENRGEVVLTPEGKAAAERILDRHQCLTQLLVDMGVNEETAAADACKIEHVISEESFNKIKEQPTALLPAAKAVPEVRLMASQFASLYFDFVSSLYHSFGRDTAIELTTKLLFERAKARAEIMIEKAAAKNLERSPENILALSDVAYLGWDHSLGADHCPYGKLWREKSELNPWFREFAQLYCDVTDTTIAEIFTGTHSHKLHKNVVLGHDSCQREYFPSKAVAEGRYSYQIS